MVWVVTSTLTFLNVGESRLPMVMSQVSSPRAVVLPLIPFTTTSERVMSFLASLGNRDIGTMQVEHPESSIATPEKVMSLKLKVDWTSGEW